MKISTASIVISFALSHTLAVGKRVGTSEKRTDPLLSISSTTISRNPPLFYSPITASHDVAEIYSQLNGTNMHFFPILYTKLILLIDGIKQSLK
jgi:hypothetical protein